MRMFSAIKLASSMNSMGKEEEVVLRDSSRSKMDLGVIIIEVQRRCRRVIMRRVSGC